MLDALFMAPDNLDLSQAITLEKALFHLSNSYLLMKRITHRRITVDIIRPVGQGARAYIRPIAEINMEHVEYKAEHGRAQPVTQATHARHHPLYEALSVGITVHGHQGRYSRVCNGC
jgi:hypothetical protein